MTHSTPKKQRTIAFILTATASVLLIIIFTSARSVFDSLLTIDIQKQIQKVQEVPVSKFSDNLEYIPLELTPESTIGQDMKINLTKDYIIVRNYARGVNSLLLLFDRKSGKFIRQIGKIGRGPEEYSRPLDCFYNPYDKKMYTYGDQRSSIKLYSLEGKFLEAFETPKLTDPSIKDGVARLSIDGFLNPDTYVGYIENSTGALAKKVALFSKSKEIISFPNYTKWSSPDSKVKYVTINQSPKFSTWDRQISFKERSNDTLFGIAESKLIPRLVLNTGDYRYPNKITQDEALSGALDNKDYLDILNLFENSSSIFFEYSFKRNEIVEGMLETYLLIFDKKTKSIIVSQNQKNRLAGLKDDINNFMPVSPIKITEDNQMIAFLRPIEILKWLTENPSASAGMMAKFPWLKNINEMDNPVIVIGKCKN